MADPWQFHTPNLPVYVPAAAPIAVRVGAVCRRDGVSLVLHARCTGCSVLSGPEHAVDQLVDGRCSSCA